MNHKKMMLLIQYYASSGEGSLADFKDTLYGLRLGNEDETLVLSEFQKMYPEKF